MMGWDALGTAMLDHQRGELRGELRYRDGDDTRVHDVAATYFGSPDDLPDDTVAILRSLDGPVVDVGCGAGQHALWLQAHGREVVAFDVSPGAVEAARERGVEDARVLDMFEMPFERDRFASALVVGTQAGLAGSLSGVRAFLADLARVTDERGVAVVDSYDPAELDGGFLGYRPDPRPGVARRAFHFEYERVAGDDPERLVGPTLPFVLFGPDRLQDVVVGTPWTVVEVSRRGAYYRAVLEKGQGPVTDD